MPTPSSHVGRSLRRYGQLAAVAIMRCAVLPMFIFAATVAKAQEVPEVLLRPQLRILLIGNSYGLGATQRLDDLVQASGADVSDLAFYRCYRSSASFKSWCDVYADADTAYTYTVTRITGDLDVPVRRGKAESRDGSLFRDALTATDWDLVIINQLSTFAPYYERYNGWRGTAVSQHLDELLAIVRRHQPQAQIGFLLVHSYWDAYASNAEGSSLERWQHIATSAEAFAQTDDCDLVIPYGTAIENLRLTSLNNDYDLTRDGTHCCYGLGEYTAACALFESLLAPRYGLTVVGNAARYDAAQASATKYPSVSVTDANALIAQQAAALAVAAPYELTNPEQTLVSVAAPRSHTADMVQYYTLDGRAISPAPVPSTTRRHPRLLLQRTSEGISRKVLVR